MSTVTEEIFQKIREEKDVFQKAKLVRSLSRDHNLRIKDIAKNLGKQSSYICHLLRICNIPDIIVDGYYSSQVTISHLFIISRLKDPKSMIRLYEDVLTNNLTIAKTEEKVREALYNVKTEGSFLSPEEKSQFAEKFSQFTQNTEVKIVQTRIKSSLLLNIKGSLKKTTPVLREFLRIIRDWNSPKNV